MDRYTQLTGVRTTDAGRIRTLQSNNGDKFYIEVEFFNPLGVVEVAEMCKHGDIYKYSIALIDKLRGDTNKPDEKT